MQVKVMVPAAMAAAPTVTVRSPAKTAVGSAVEAGAVNLHVLAAAVKPVTGKTILPRAATAVAVLSVSVRVTPVAAAVLSERVTAADEMAPTAVMAGREAVVVRSISVPAVLRVKMVKADEAT